MDKTSFNENFVFFKKMSAFFKSFFKEKRDDSEAVERNDLLSDIEKAIEDIRYARNCFESAKSPEMIDACIYEIKSAEARYSFLLRKARASFDTNKIEI